MAVATRRSGHDHPAGTVELVDAALASYAHPRLRWLARQHVLAALRDFPSLSPSFDTYTGDDGASAVLLNAQGLLAVSPALPPLRLTAWLPRGYPHEAPVVYVFPDASEPSAGARARATLVPDHPFVDHRTGRVRHTLPFLEGWSVPASTLTGLLRSLAGALRMCHPLSFTYDTGTTTCLLRTSSERHHDDEDNDDGDLEKVDDEVLAMSSVQASLRARGNAMDRAVGELEEERMRLERAVTACLGHRDRLLGWLQHAADQIDRAADMDDAAMAPLEPQVAAAAGGAAAAQRWLEGKASELALDDAMDALGHAMENGTLAFPEYMKRIKMLAREQFFHCHAASTAMPKRGCSLMVSSE